MSEFLERLKKIPPWGYAVIAFGVLVLAFFTKNSRASNEGQTLYEVNPAAETANNDAEWRMQDMYNRLEDKMNENDATYAQGLSDMQDQWAAYKSGQQTQYQYLKDTTDWLKNGDNLKSALADPNKYSGVTTVGHWYTVQSGDTLTNIAQRAYYGKNPEITTNWLTDDPNNTKLSQNGLQQGMKIWIPTG